MISILVSSCPRWRNPVDGVFYERTVAPSVVGVATSSCYHTYPIDLERGDMHRRGVIKGDTAAPCPACPGRIMSASRIRVGVSDIELPPLRLTLFRKLSCMKRREEDRSLPSNSLQERARPVRQKRSWFLQTPVARMTPSLVQSVTSNIRSLLHLFHPSHIVANLSNHFQRLVLRILRSGPVPRHVAFVMDGNRRFARERGWVVRRGHEEGFESLKSVRARLFPFPLWPERLTLFRSLGEDLVPVCRAQDTVYHRLRVLDR
jgi:hypothetical protein